jgi:fatty-acyl-CoA synthase
MTPGNANPYEMGLDKNAANYVPLSPIGFLVRSAAVYPNRLAVVHGKRRSSWREALERCRRLAAALAARGVGRGDTVALMAPNIPEAFEAHFGVPMAVGRLPSHGSRGQEPSAHQNHHRRIAVRLGEQG